MEAIQFPIPIVYAEDGNVLHTDEFPTCSDASCPCWAAFLASFAQAEQSLYRHLLYFGNVQDAEASFAMLDEVFESGLAELEDQVDGLREIRLVFATVALLALPRQAALRTLLAGIVAYDFNREEGARIHDA